MRFVEAKRSFFSYRTFQTAKRTSCKKTSGGLGRFPRGVLIPLVQSFGEGLGQLVGASQASALERFASPLSDHGTAGVGAEP